MKIKDYFTERRLNRLEGDLTMLSDKLNFNPRYAFGDLDKNRQDAFTQKIEEYRVWSMGDATLLRDLYKTHVVNGTLNYFWRRVPSTSMMKHSGIPGLISSKMGSILFGNGIGVDVLSTNDDGSENEKRGKEVCEFIQTLYDQLQCADKFQKGATVESWGGHVFYKFSADTTLSNYPILEVADITQGRVIKQRGITKAIIFAQYFTEKEKTYRLDEIYSTDANGDATIEYRLFAFESGREVEKPLISTAHTQGLADNPLITFVGIKGMLAFEKPNKTPSLLFPYSNYGASDYEGALDSFDAMDEAYTAIMKEMRTNRTVRYIPQSMIPRDSGGQYVLNDDFTDAYVQVVSDDDQNSKDAITVTTIPDKTDDNKAKYLTALTTALNKAGISPYAIGLTGLESVNASAESQQERNKVTLETRAGKLRKWEPFIENILIRMCELNDWMLTHTNAKQPYGKLGVTWDNTTIRVSFGDYVAETSAVVIQNMAAGKSAGIISTDEAVRSLHPDWDETQILDEVNRIRYEQGMSLDNPLSLPELTGVEVDNDTAVGIVT